MTSQAARCAPGEAAASRSSGLRAGVGARALGVGGAVGLTHARQK